MRSAEKQRFAILADIADVPVPKHRTIERIYIHCSAVETGDAEIIDKWHRARGWHGIGYNFVVGGQVNDADGVGYQPGFIQLGRPVEKIPDNVESDNNYSLGICIIGNFDNESPFEPGGKDSTRIAMESALILAAELSLRLDLPIRQVVGHREVNLIPGRSPTTKSCPGFMFNMDEFRYYLYRRRKFDYTAGHHNYSRMIERFLHGTRFKSTTKYKFHGGRKVVKSILENSKGV